jgi:hypothetical protein
MGAIGQIIKPGIAKQLALGFYKDLDNGRYEINVETYYKIMSNQIEFRPGARLLLNQNLEGEMIFGSGKAYGVEVFFQKKIGRLTGWIGYTLSRAERTYPEMNEGKPFPYRYDRTHDISVVANYRLGKKWETSAVFCLRMEMHPTYREDSSIMLAITSQIGSQYIIASVNMIRSTIIECLLITGLIYPLRLPQDRIAQSVLKAAGILACIMFTIDRILTLYISMWMMIHKL